MRVGLVSAYYFPATVYGGPVWVVKDLAEALAARGHSVDVFTTTANHPKDGGKRIESFERLTVRYSRRWGGDSWFLSPEMATALCSHIRTLDVLYIHGLWTFPVLMAARLARFSGTPYVLVPHGALDPWALRFKSAKKRAYLRLFERETIRQAACIHCLTEAEAAQVLGVENSAHCRVVPNPVTIIGKECVDVENEFVANAPRLIGKKIVLFLSRLHQKKGLERLLEAWALVSERGHAAKAHLVIAGAGESSYEASLRDLVRSRCIGDSVTFAGHLDGKLKSCAFSAASMFVLPSYSEGLPIAALEAMAFAKPLVVTRETNIADVVESAGAGLVVTHAAEDIARAIQSMLSAPADSERMGLAAAAVAKERFSIEVVTSGVERMLFEAARVRERLSDNGNA